MMSPCKMLPGQQLQKQGAAWSGRRTGQLAQNPEKEDRWDVWPVPANSAKVLGAVLGRRCRPGLCDPRVGLAQRAREHPKKTNFSSLAGTPFQPQPCLSME